MTHFVRLQNGAALLGIVIEENLRQVVPQLANVSLFTPELVEPHGYGIYDFSSQPEVTRYQKAVEVPPVRDSRGIWMQTWSVQPMTPEEVAAADTKKAEEVRAQRAYFLFRSDWTQISDAPLTAEQRVAWSNYRQQLRDVPAQSGFPWDVTWPTSP